MKIISNYSFFFTIGLMLSSCNVRTWNSVERSTPPYEYDFAAAKTGSSVVVLPVTLEQRIYQPAYRNALSPLVDSLNGRLSRLEWVMATRALDLPGSSMPVLYFGTPQNRDPATGGPPSESPPSKPSPMIIAYSAPTADWKAAIDSRLREAGAEYVIVVTLGFSEYTMDRTFVLESKVYLGTDYSKRVTWVLDPNEPIQVLHLVGALIDRSGTVVRVAVEGLIASETTGPARALLSKVTGGKSIIRESEIASLLDETRRTDISGEPLVLHVAIDNLLARLTGQADRVHRPVKE